MPTVRFMGRRDVETHCPMAPTHLVSISDGEDDQAQIVQSRWASVAFEYFVDGEYDETRMLMFGAKFPVSFQDYLLPPQADSVRSLVDRLASTGLDIVVNCQAGRSRSAAVARYISERHGYDLKQETPDANQTVLRLLRRDSSLCSTYRDVTSPSSSDQKADGVVRALLKLLGLWTPSRQ